MDKSLSTHFYVIFDILQCIRLVTMSHLIDLLCPDSKNNFQPSTQYWYSDCNMSKAKRSLSNSINNLGLTYKSQQLRLSDYSDCFYAIVESPSFYDKYSFMIKIHYKSTSKTLIFSCLLLHCGRPFTVSTKSMRLSSLMPMNQCNLHFYELATSLDLENGQIRVKNCATINDQILNKMDLLSWVMDKLLKSLIQNNGKFVKMFKQMSNDFTIEKKLLISLSPWSSNFKRISSILKYLKISFTELEISEVQLERKKVLEKPQITERKRLHNYVPLDISNNQINKSMSLFQVSEFPIEELEDIVLTEQEIEQFNSFLVWPKAKMKSEEENQFIFNQIVIEHQNQVQIAKTNMRGGTAELLCAFVTFQYVVGEKTKEGSNNKKGKSQIKNFQRERRTLTKKMLIKKPISKSAEKYLQHEMQIVSLMRLASSAYMLKYYKTEQKCPLQNLMLMDYLPNSMDLHTYYCRHRETMSVHTKIFIMAGIVNGLRFLRNHNITHMDLTPKNILITSGLMPKIIDFGEAYCFFICKKDYSPGFTNPYGPPEVFTHKAFSTKQDVFSFGMILFRLMFNRLPFEPTDALKRSYANYTYNNKLFFSVESMQYTWLETPMLLLLALFVRCKNVDPLNRPYPTWMRVILKLILDWSHDLFTK